MRSLPITINPEKYLITFRQKHDKSIYEKKFSAIRRENTEHNSKFFYISSLIFFLKYKYGTESRELILVKV